MILRSWLAFVACNLVWLLIGLVYSVVFLFCYSFLIKTSFFKALQGHKFLQK